MAVTLLFPSDVLTPTKVDEHFRGEANAARELGFDVALLDHDAVVAGDIDEAVRRVRDPAHPLLYRGWMMQPDAYHQVERALAERGGSMAVSGEEFARSHHLPNWFDLAGDNTAATAWTEGRNLDDFVAALERLGPGAAVLKDYSKSEKAYWDEAMFIPDTTETKAACAVAKRFAELREDYFDGGFVVRRFESYEPGECRSWWVAGVCVLVTAHPDTPEVAPTIEATDLPQLASTPSSFFTMDVARLADTGDVRIIELGDGQVSDRPSSTPADSFLKAITDRLS